jgi:hypothetical protein
VMPCGELVLRTADGYAEASPDDVTPMDGES